MRSMDVIAARGGLVPADYLSDLTGTVNPPRHRLGFALFLLLNAVLFVRPAEVWPALGDWPIYLVVLLLCWAASFSSFLEQLTWQALSREPAVLCIIGLLPAILLSHLSHGRTYEARMAGVDFGKVLIYFLLLIGLVNSPARLRTFLVVVTLSVSAIAVLALLHHHEVINLPALDALDQHYGMDEETGEMAVVVRLRATGIFNDPNDFSLVLVAGMMVCVHWLAEKKSWLVRMAWLVPLAILAYAFALTRSRGGFLSLIAGLGVLMISRLGWRRAIPIAVITLPMLLVLFGGRMTDIDLNDQEDTAQGRILLWRDSLVLFHSSPMFGIGYGQLAEENGLVAHNSYVHAFGELGLLGGTLFAGAMHLLFMGLWQYRPESGTSAQSGLQRLWPYIVAILTGYAIGLCSLSRLYALATYLILGIAVVYSHLVVRERPWVVRSLDGVMLRQVILGAIGCLVFFEIFVRLFAS